MCRVAHATRQDECNIALAEIIRLRQQFPDRAATYLAHQEVVERAKRGFWACDGCVGEKRVYYPNIHSTSSWVSRVVGQSVGHDFEFIKFILKN